MKPPGFDPWTYEVKTWFQAFAFKRVSLFRFGKGGAFWKSAPKFVTEETGEDGSVYLSIGMRDRLSLLKRVQGGVKRALTPAEVGEIVAMENDAYAAYFALRMGVCRRAWWIFILFRFSSRGRITNNKMTTFSLSTLVV
jgi:hypothetical protein